MTGSEALLLAVVVGALVAAASLEVAVRSLPRLELRRWARSALAAEGEGDDAPEALEIPFTALRLTRQMLLLAMAVVVARLCLAWAGPWGLSAAFAGVFAVYMLVDKALAFGLVLALGPLRVLRYGWPLLVVLRGVLGWLAGPLYRVLRRARARSQAPGQARGVGDLAAFLDLAEEEGVVAAGEEELLRGVADFGEAVVREVMTPRVEMVCIDAEASFTELMRLVAERKLSRVPVVQASIDNVVGIVHIKDLITALEAGRKDAPVTAIARPAIFVPETKRVGELLREFQRRRAQMAVVVDEYGGTAGLVTLEDLLEEIVGEIQDEYDEAEEAAVREAEGVVVAPGKTEIEEIERLLDVEISDQEFETVAGMAFVCLGHVPQPGETFDYGDLHVEVLEADDRRVQRVRIRRR